MMRFKREWRARRIIVRSAFTLVELLVVIGIIALLISILLPALSRAKQTANRVKCLSNLRQLGMGFQLYALSNKGRFPFDAVDNATPWDEDWIWWQEVVVPPSGASPGRTVLDLQQSRVALALGSAAPALFRCPSEDYDNRVSVAAQGGRYRYSYSMNFHMASDRKQKNGLLPPPLGGIHTSAEHILLVEETLTTINDGSWEPPMFDDNGAYVTGSGTLDLLNIIHDTAPAQKDSGFNPLPNSDRRGNAAFVDGHAEYITRKFAHNQNHLDPYLP